MMASYWGEIPSVSDTDSEIAALEREQMTKPRPLEIQGPDIYQPWAVDTTSSKKQHPVEDFCLDSLTMHTIKLIQYTRKVTAMIHNVGQQIESLNSEEGEMPNFPPAPPIPELHPAAPTSKSENKPLPFLPSDPASESARGFGKAPPEIDGKTCRRLVRRSVAAICAHVGYENCAQSILETMTDICHEYFLQMTQLLRRSVDSEAVNGGTAFPDVMVQVFHEMGIGDPRVLHDFYQTRVVNYHHNMLQSCENLKREYERVKNPETRTSAITKSLIRVKEEPVSDIQFPSLDELEEGGDGESVLHLEGLGLDISIVQDSSSQLNNEEEGTTSNSSSTRWQNLAVKTEIGENRVASLDSLDRDDGQPANDLANTPADGSEAGDSLQDPNSVSASDIMSPPSIGHRPAGMPLYKKMKK